MGKPQAPAPPDPKETSAAATGTAVATSIANTSQGNVNQSNPYGSLTYEQTGTTSFTDPYTGLTYEIPQYSANTTLSPEQQAIYNNQTAMQTSLGSAGATAAAGFAPTQTAVPTYNNYSTSAGLNTNYGTSAGLNTVYGSEDYSADRDEYEAALMARMEPSLSAQQEALDASLANQGIGYGAEAYNDAQLTQSQAQNDAEMAAILAAGEEQQRMYNMDMSAQTASNAALQQEFANQASGLTNQNNALQQEFSNFNSGTGANNSNLSNTFTQSMQSQNDYMNQIMTMLGASSPTAPNFPVNQPSPIPTTDNAGIINNNYAQEQAAYQQQMAQYNSMWGNLFGLGGDALAVI